MIVKYWYRIFAKLKLENGKLKFIRRFASLFVGKYCWADCVAWAFSATRFNPFKIEPSKGCEIESADKKTCYCGGWADGKCVEKLSETEIEILRESLT